MFSISFNTSLNRNKTSSNKRVKRVRLKFVDEKNESKQKNNNDKKFAFRKRLIENDDDDATNNVKKNNNNNFNKNDLHDNVNENSSRSRQKSNAKILEKRKCV